MDQIKRRDAGIAYIADKEVMEQAKACEKADSGIEYG